MHGHLSFRAEIHQAQISQFPLLADFLMLQVSSKDFDRRVLTLVNFNPNHNRLRYLKGFDKPGQDLSRMKDFSVFLICLLNLNFCFLVSYLR